MTDHPRAEEANLTAISGACEPHYAEEAEAPGPERMEDRIAWELIVLFLFLLGMTEILPVGDGIFGILMAIIGLYFLAPALVVLAILNIFEVIRAARHFHAWFEGWRRWLVKARASSQD